MMIPDQHRAAGAAMLNIVCRPASSSGPNSCVCMRACMCLFARLVSLYDAHDSQKKKNKLELLFYATILSAR